VSARVERRSAVPRTSPLDAAQLYLQRADELRMLADRPRAPRWRAEPLPLPVARELGPPNFGDAARLAAAVRELHRVMALAPAASDRRAVLAARVRAGEMSVDQARDAIAESEAAHRALADRIAAADARVRQVKAEIREARLAAGARHDRALRQLRARVPELFEDCPVLGGVRPAPGSRLKPQPPPPTPTTADTTRGWVDKIVERL